MPAVVSHYLLAERVYKRLSAAMPELEKNIFLWGASGPDIFFAHRVMPWQFQPSIAKISHIMHNCNAEPLLNYLYEYARAKESTAARSYAFGFVTHYAFDSVAHPYIVGYAEEKAGGQIFHISIAGKANEQIAEGIKLSSVYHNKLEGELDTIFLMHEKHVPIHKMKLQDTCPEDRSSYETVAEIMNSYLTDSGIHPDVQNYEIVRAMLDWRKCLTVLNDRFSLKRNSMKALEKLLGFPPVVSVFMRNVKIDLSADPANLMHSTWTAPSDGTLHNESFLELADIAEQKSMYLINKFLCGEYLTREDCFDSFSGH